MSDAILYAVRRNNLKVIIEGFRTKAEFARASDLSTAQVSQLSGDNEKYRIGSEVAKKIEKAGGKPEGWLDVDREGAEPEAIPHLDIIVETVSAVNQILVQHDMSPDRMVQDRYQEILRTAIITCIELGKVTPAQVQHTLLSTLIGNNTAH